MSKLSEYSKFDHLDSDDDDDNDDNNNNKVNERINEVPLQESTTEKVVTQGGATRKNESNGRYIFEHNGRLIYEWEQTLDEVTIYVPAPSFVTKAKQVKCNITPNHLQLGLEGGTQWFINEDTYGTVDVSESTWVLEKESSDKQHMTITIYLTKANRAHVWEAALKSKTAQVASMDPFTKQQVQKDLLLERFQEEHPGMDFRGADFNGSVPDPRTFMGGVNYR